MPKRVLPFRSPWRPNDPGGPLPPELQSRVRYLIDRYQVLLLNKPVVAAWLINWVDLFLSKHLD